MSIDSDAFRQMLAAAPDATEHQASDQEHQVADEFEEPPVAFEEPPITSELIEPPIRIEEPPPSMEELEAAAADELLKIASEEEKDRQKIQKTQRAKDTFVICCPKGCRIRVKEQHRGRSGKCPRCQSEFVIPKNKPAAKD